MHQDQDHQVKKEILVTEARKVHQELKDNRDLQDSRD